MQAKWMIIAEQRGDEFPEGDPHRRAGFMLCTAHDVPAKFEQHTAWFPCPPRQRGNALKATSPPVITRRGGRAALKLSISMPAPRGLRGRL